MEPAPPNPTGTSSQNWNQSQDTTHVSSEISKAARHTNCRYGISNLTTFVRVEHSFDCNLQFSALVHTMASPAIARPALGRVFSTANPAARTTVTCLLAQRQQPQPHKSFSTTSHLAERRTRRDNNKKRGLSSMYPGSKLRHRMQIQPSEMPLPARNYEPKVETDPDHGLWEFFYARKQRFLEPDEMEAHGRAWHVEELRHKSWEDLHSLWWTCVKERNRLVTMATEYETAGFTVGQNSMDERDVEVSYLPERHWS